MEAMVGLIDVERIMDLPWIVKGPGMALIVLFLFRAVRCVFSLRLITVFTSLIYAFAIAVLLSQVGDAIVQLIGVEEETAEQTLFTPASPSGFRYTV